MVPGQKFDKPGKSPFMDMDLVPVYADEGEGKAASRCPVSQQNLGIRVVEVARAPWRHARGGRQCRVQRARRRRGAGAQQRLCGKAVRARAARSGSQGPAAGQLYVPDWVAAQEEYLAVKRMPAGPDTAGLLDAALQRMRLAGMTRRADPAGERAIAGQRASRDGAGRRRRQRAGGREGMAVTRGRRCSGSTACARSGSMPRCRRARRRRSGPACGAGHSPALPGHGFQRQGRGAAAGSERSHAHAEGAHRTGQSGGKLVPGMFATIHIAPAQRRETLLVPSEAVIQTGTRSVVIVAAWRRQVRACRDRTIGARPTARPRSQRLSAGQKVVASGQFLIDSEASLRGANASAVRPDGGAGARRAHAVPTHHATGKVEQIAGDEVTISHGPIPSLKWGPMTMGFMPPASGLPKDVKVGDTVQFEFEATRTTAMFRIVSIVEPQARHGRR
jgi:Cu(I)/Ag(I) efflux system membrane fusion protein